MLPAWMVLVLKKASVEWQGNSQRISRGLKNGETLMERIKCLNYYQKCLLFLMAIMILVFTVLYPVTISRVGFEYKGTVLVPSQENGDTVYSGKIQGKQAHLTVSEDKSVVFQHGDKIYGPYTIKEDAAAIPENEEMAEHMTGVELRRGEDILFRGGVLDTGNFYCLYSEDGTLDNVGIFYVGSDGIERDNDGNVVNSVEPSVSTILELVNNPELIHKGKWFAWFAAVFICAFNTVSVLFADELFRWDLAFRIRNADHAEPSDLEIAGRYIGWTAILIVALVIFIMGLQ